MEINCDLEMKKRKFIPLFKALKLFCITCHLSRRILKEILQYSLYIHILYSFLYPMYAYTFCVILSNRTSIVFKNNGNLYY